MQAQDADCNDPEGLDTVMLFKRDNHPRVEEQTEDKEAESEEEVRSPALAERSDGEDHDKDDDVSGMMDPAGDQSDSLFVVDRAKRQVQDQIANEETDQRGMQSRICA
ncbi:hypothetical protein DFQ28_005645 [Apophysomyces sp. BC1034]|nr:hypothetical protein DFQ28_005645 [Apophysomyces sp. BC1034]